MSSLKLDNESIREALTSEFLKSVNTFRLIGDDEIKVITNDYRCRRRHLNLRSSYDYDDFNESNKPGIRFQNLIDIVSLSQRLKKMRERQRTAQDSFWSGLAKIAKTNLIGSIAWPCDADKQNYRLYYAKSKWRSDSGSLTTTTSERLLEDFSKDSLKKPQILFLNDDDTHHYNFLYDHERTTLYYAFYLEEIFQRVVELCIAHQNISHDMIFLEIDGEKYTILTRKLAKVIENKDDYLQKNFYWLMGHISYDKTIAWRKFI